MRPEHPQTTAPPSAITDTRQIAVRRIGQALDFYLARGYEVISVADGWALLRMGAAEVVLLAASPARRRLRSVDRDDSVPLIGGRTFHRPLPSSTTS